MIISCIGHAKFLIELENGMRLVTDPYDATCGYPVTPLRADAVRAVPKDHPRPGAPDLCWERTAGWHAPCHSPL